MATSLQRRRTRIQKRNNMRIYDSEKLSEATNKFNFTPAVESGALDFSFGENYSSTIVFKAELSKMEVSESSAKTEEKTVKTEKDEVSTFTPPRSIVGAVSTKDINLLKDLLKENHSEDQGQINHALMLAITMRQADMVECLLDSGADMHAFDEWYPVLLTAVDIKAHDVFEMLLQRTKDVNVSSNYGNLAHSATRTGDLNIMNRICELGVDINFSCKANGTTPLHEAVKSVRFNGKAWLSDVMEDANLKGTKRKMCNTNKAEKQLDYDNTMEADIEKQNADKTSKTNYDLSVLEFLINNGCKIDIADHSGKTPLHEASIMGNIAVVKCLLDAGAKVNALDNFSNTPFMFALQHNHYKVADMLVDVEKLNIPVSENDYYAHLACKSSNFKTLEYLVAKGADMTVKSNGETPLLMAVTQRANAKCISALLKCECDINYRNNNGDTALDLLLGLWCPLSFKNIVTEMVSHGATVNHIHPETGIPPLMKHIDNNEIVLALLENGADVDFVSENGDNVLLQACLNQNVNVVQSLMMYNININISDKVKTEGEHHHMTPLQISILNQKGEIINMLLCAGCSLRNMHSWLKETELCSILRRHEPYYEQIFSYIESTQHKPCTLQNTARHSVVKAVGPVQLESKLDQICLPKIIKKCLSWKTFYASRKSELYD